VVVVVVVSCFSMLELISAIFPGVFFGLVFEDEKSTALNNGTSSIVATYLDLFDVCLGWVFVV
jgi:hypothetical protein